MKGYHWVSGDIVVPGRRPAGKCASEEKVSQRSCSFVPLDSKLYLLLQHVNLLGRNGLSLIRKKPKTKTKTQNPGALRHLQKKKTLEDVCFNTVSEKKCWRTFVEGYPLAQNRCAHLSTKWESQEFMIQSFQFSLCTAQKTSTKEGSHSPQKNVEAGKYLHVLASNNCICLYWVLIQQDTFVVEEKTGNFYTVSVNPASFSRTRFDTSQSLMLYNLTY